MNVIQFGTKIYKQKIPDSVISETQNTELFSLLPTVKTKFINKRLNIIVNRPTYRPVVTPVFPYIRNTETELLIQRRVPLRFIVMNGGFKSY